MLTIVFLLFGQTPSAFSDFALAATSDSEVITADDGSPILHFELLGPEWGDWAAGYAGPIPEKVIVKLNISRGYLLEDSAKHADPSKLRTSAIIIQFFYPSGRPPIGRGTNEYSLKAIMKPANEQWIRNGIAAIINKRGVIRAPSSDVNGLCSYRDTSGPGVAEIQYYLSCSEMDRPFTIFCSPLPKGGNLCSDNAYLHDHVGVNVSYKDNLLAERGSVLAVVERVVLSFETPKTEAR